jgi:phosphoglucomutase
VLLNGNQTAALLQYYVLKKWSEKGMLSGNEFVVKTIVTSELLADIATNYGVEYYDVLTGFKWIADVIARNEGKKKFICGGEESYGFMVGDFVRDKDAVSFCALIAEAAAWALDEGKGLYNMLIDMYVEIGFYLEKLISVVRKGKSGAEEIKAMMDDFRSDPPTIINNSRVVMIKDYLTLKETDYIGETEKNINLPSSNVLQFYLEDGSKISVRPSGTEPKIKFYFSVKDELKSKEDFQMMHDALSEKLEALANEFN